jgi:hypothetical protein
MAKIVKVIAKPADPKEVKKLQKKLKKTKEKVDPEVKVVFPHPAYEHLKVLNAALMEYFETGQVYIKRLENTVVNLKKMNEDLIKVAERKMNIALTERLIIALLWAVSVFIVCFMK